MTDNRALGNALMRESMAFRKLRVLTNAASRKLAGGRTVPAELLQRIEAARADLNAIRRGEY